MCSAVSVERLPSEVVPVHKRRRDQGACITTAAITLRVLGEREATAEDGKKMHPYKLIQNTA